MIEYEDLQFQNVQATGSSAALGSWGYLDKWVACIGLTGGTATVQWSNDGTNWQDLKDASGNDVTLTAAGQNVPIDAPARELRIRGDSLTGTYEFWFSYAQ